MAYKCMDCMKLNRHWHTFCLVFVFLFLCLIQHWLVFHFQTKPTNESFCHCIYDNELDIRVYFICILIKLHFNIIIYKIPHWMKIGLWILLFIFKCNHWFIFCLTMNCIEWINYSQKNNFFHNRSRIYDNFFFFVFACLRTIRFRFLIVIVIVIVDTCTPIIQ